MTSEGIPWASTDVPRSNMRGKSLAIPRIATKSQIPRDTMATHQGRHGNSLGSRGQRRIPAASHGTSHLPWDSPRGPSDLPSKLVDRPMGCILLIMRHIPWALSPPIGGLIRRPVRRSMGSDTRRLPAPPLKLKGGDRPRQTCIWWNNIPWGLS